MTSQAQTLPCEYVVVGSDGQGWTVKIHVPATPLHIPQNLALKAAFGIADSKYINIAYPVIYILSGNNTILIEQTKWPKMDLATLLNDHF